MKRLQVLSALALLCALSTAAHAQRPRAAGDAQQPATATTPSPAPTTVKAKYEGGYTGAAIKQTGTLVFDDANGRLLFKDKFQKEYVSLPYKSLAAVWGDKRAVTSTAARVVGAAPYGIGLASLLMPKSKSRYLVVQFDDPDTKVQGTTSFKLQNKEMLASVVNTLAQKAALRARGDAFIRAPADDKK